MSVNTYDAYVASFITQQRTKRNMTMTELASKTNVVRATIHNIENMKSPVKLSHFIQILSVFKLSFKDFETWKDNTVNTEVALKPQLKRSYAFVKVS